MSSGRYPKYPSEGLVSDVRIQFTTTHLEAPLASKQHQNAPMEEAMEEDLLAPLHIGYQSASMK